MSEPFQNHFKTTSNYFRTISKTCQSHFRTISKPADSKNTTTSHTRTQESTRRTTTTRQQDNKNNKNKKQQGQQEQQEQQEQLGGATDHKSLATFKPLFNQGKVLLATFRTKVVKFSFKANGQGCARFQTKETRSSSLHECVLNPEQRLEVSEVG